MACRLKLSSTFVNGQTTRCTADAKSNSHSNDSESKRVDFVRCYVKANWTRKEILTLLSRDHFERLT